MNLTLLVENNPQIESCYTLNLLTWLGLETVVMKKTALASTYLQENPGKINLIIVRANIDKTEAAKEMISFVQTNGLNIPVIVIGPGKEIPGSFVHVPNSLQIKILIQGAAKALGITAKDMGSKVVPNHYPIPIHFFKLIKRSVCPVYEKDTSAAGSFKILFPKLKEFQSIEIENLVKAGVKFLYVDKLDRLEFVNFVTSEFMAVLKDSDLSLDEQVTAADKSLELLSKKILALGVTEETITLANKSMESMRKNARTSPKISKLLERLISNKTSYLYKHTQILTYIGLHIIKNIDWGNPEQEEKISFISFFHDIALEQDAHAQVKSNLELKKSSFTQAEKQLVEKHAQIAAEFVSKFPHAPMGSDQIIRQHHGTLNGVGFSEHYGNNVSPIAIVFIVAEEFTRIIMKRESGPFDREEMLRELKEEFPTSRFQKMVDLLQSITI